MLAYYWTYSLASHSPFLFLWEFQGYWLLRNFLDFFHHFFFLELEFTQFFGFTQLLKEFSPAPFSGSHLMTASACASRAVWIHRSELYSQCVYQWQPGLWWQALEKNDISRSHLDRQDGIFQFSSQPELILEHTFPFEDFSWIIHIQQVSSHWWPWDFSLCLYL